MLLIPAVSWAVERHPAEYFSFTVEVHASGEVGEGIPEILQKTWSYFLNDRLKPFLEK